MNKRYRSIEAILPPPPFHMVGNGFRVHNFFPSLNIIGERGMSPFFLLDYNSPWNTTPSEQPRGVGVHPHRGLETVTIAYKGRIAHHDSYGNGGVIGEGDVQWMTAGSGILHKEYHEKEFSRKGGLFHMVQLWVNLPVKDKFTTPKYQAIENNRMAKSVLDDGVSVVEIIAGSYNGFEGPAFTFSPVSLFNARLKRGTAANFSFSSRDNSGLLVIGGNVKINDSRQVPADHFVLFGHDGEGFSVEAADDSVILILAGEPINEPIAAYGPFLMNTKEEIQQAYDDYYNGKFGYLED